MVHHEKDSLGGCQANARYIRGKCFLGAGPARGLYGAVPMLEYAGADIARFGYMTLTCKLSLEVLLDFEMILGWL